MIIKVTKVLSWHQLLTQKIGLNEPLKMVQNMLLFESSNGSSLGLRLVHVYSSF